MSKMASRKFIVWIITVLLLVITVAVTKTVSADMVNGYILISIAYIGGNTIKHYIDKK